RDEQQVVAGWPEHREVTQCPGQSHQDCGHDEAGPQAEPGVGEAVEDERSQQEEGTLGEAQHPGGPEHDHEADSDEGVDRAEGHRGDEDQGCHVLPQLLGMGLDGTSSRSCTASFLLVEYWYSWNVVCG